MMMANGIYFVQRIDEILEKNGKKRAELLRDLELPRNSITNWSDRGNVPAGDICLKIAEYLNVSVEWLISGKESGLSNEEKWLLSQWKALDPAQKDTVRTLLDKWESDRTAQEREKTNA